MKPFHSLWAFFLVWLNLCISSYAQEHPAHITSGYWNELYKAVASQYGFDQVLVNGRCYEDVYRGKMGHPFLFENRFYTGSMIFRGKEYQGLNIKYDIVGQQLLLYISQDNTSIWVIPPADFISAFSLGDYQFLKTTIQGVPQYCQVVFDSEKLKCLYSWSKLRYDSDHNQDFSSFRFTESMKKTYLVVNDDLHNYSDHKSFIRLFPQEVQMHIKQYLKKHRLKVAESSGAGLEGLMAYCVALL